MFAMRILVAFAPPLTAEQAARSIAAARAAAARPQLLRFALPACLQPQVDPEDIAPLFYDGRAPEGLCPLLTDETHFLLLAGEHAFAPKWDAQLLAALRALPQRHAVLTGCIRPGTQAADVCPAPPAQTLHRMRAVVQRLRDNAPTMRIDAAPPTQPSAPALPPQACLPALGDHFENNAAPITHGLALVCPAAPVRTLVIDPALLFGSVRFLAEVTTDPDTISIAAYVAGVPVYALPDAVVWPMHPLPARLLRRPVPDVLPGTTLARFEQLAGFRYDQGRAGVKTTWGLFGPEDTYPQRMPPALLAAQRLRSAAARLRESPMPLLVSAFIDLPGRTAPVAAYVLRFGFLKAIAALPLLLYTGGSQERLLRASYPNTQSYPDNRVLPKSLMQDGMTPTEHFLRSKPTLMARAAERQPEFTHVAWVDMNVLPHPVCPDALPDFSPLMDDYIHIATVNGVPDLSFIHAPKRLLPLLRRETLSLTLLDAELKRGFGEAELWQRLYAKMPDLFVLHRMPRKGLLFLSMFDRALLSPRLKAQLNDLPQPVAPPPRTADRLKKELHL